MKYLEWQDHFAIGVDSVDYEHQNLISMINRIFAELEERRDLEQIRETMADVHREITAHFALEERIMRDANYEEYGDHKNDHEDLLDQIRSMMEAIERSPDVALDSLSEDLGDWFGNHFQTFDARLHQKFGH
jgi:hemerythrin